MKNDKIAAPPCFPPPDMVSYRRFRTTGSQTPAENLDRGNPNPICPPLWVYASAHRSDPIRRGLYHAQMEVRTHESNERDADADRYTKRQDGGKDRDEEHEHGHADRPLAATCRGAHCAAGGIAGTAGAGNAPGLRGDRGNDPRRPHCGSADPRTGWRQDHRGTPRGLLQRGVQCVHRHELRAEYVNAGAEQPRTRGGEVHGLGLRTSIMDSARPCEAVRGALCAELLPQGGRGTFRRVSPHGDRRAFGAEIRRELTHHQKHLKQGGKRWQKCHVASNCHWGGKVAGSTPLPIGRDGGVCHLPPTLQLPPTPYPLFATIFCHPFLTAALIVAESFSAGARLTAPNYEQTTCPTWGASVHRTRVSPLPVSGFFIRRKKVNGTTEQNGKPTPKQWRVERREMTKQQRDALKFSRNCVIIDPNGTEMRPSYENLRRICFMLNAAHGL